MNPREPEPVEARPDTPARRRRTKQPSHQRRRNRRLTRRALISTAGFVLFVALWIGVTGLLARAQLDSARRLLPGVTTQVLAGRTAEAHTLNDAVAVRARKAHLLTSGPIWWLAGKVPYFGRPALAVSGVTRAVDTLTHKVMPPLLSVAGDISPAALRTSGDHFAIEKLANVAPLMAEPVAASHRLRDTVGRLPDNTWMGVTNHAIAQVRSEINRLDGTLTIAYRAVQVLPPMLGRDGPTSYFVALQNEAEMRGTGGLPGTLGILRARNGTVRFDKFRSDTFLNGVTSNLPMTDEYAQMYGNAAPTTTYVNANVSPDFPTAAKIWMAMWKAKTGEALDGAIAIDPTALSYLLQDYPTTYLADRTPVNSGNVVTLTQRDAYLRYPSLSQADARKAFIVQIADAINRTLLSSRSNPQRLATSAATAAGEGRILFYSTHHEVQDVIEDTSLSGAVREADRGLTGLVINNAAGNKLDFFLSRTVGWSCQKGRATVVITLQNNAPDNLTPYITQRLDRTHGIAPVGSNMLWVDWIDMTGGELLSSSDGSDEGFVQVGSLNGHPIYRYEVELNRGSIRSIILRLAEPKGVHARKLNQPGVVPQVYTQQNPSCS